MRRSVIGAGLALALVAGCSGDSAGPGPTDTPSAPTAAGCIRIPPPAIAADGPPVAVVHDVAGGPREFYLGSPGGRLERIAEANGSSPPRLVAGRVFFSTGAGFTNQDTRVARFGECSVQVATGSMGDVDSQGRALVVTDAGRSSMADASGRRLATVAGPNGTWTGDGHLAVPTATTDLKVYDLSGAEKDITLPQGSTPTGPLGASLEMLSTPAGFQTIDLRDGKLQPLTLPASPQRLLAGSPDGAYVAVIDNQGLPGIIALSDGHSVRLPNPGPALGVVWDRSSQWVAVESLFGASAMRIADGRVVDMGALDVVSW